MLTETDDTDIRITQVGVVHGGVTPCTNREFGAIFTRLTDYNVLAWILKVGFQQKLGNY